MMNVSVCMIVWNEEKLLPTAIGSVTGLADEIIVVDTGSEDGTVELAHELGARVVEGVDRWDKSKARNRAFEEATGDWCVVLDADEKIRDPDAVRAFLEATDCNAAYVKMLTVNGSGDPVRTNQQIRLSKREAYRYKYRAHEVPLPAYGHWGKVEHTDLVWEHHHPAGREWKLEYGLARMLMDVVENPTEIRPIFYLGRQYFYLGAYGAAIERLEQYVELSPGGRDAGNALDFIAQCYSKLGNRDKQIEVLYRACAIEPKRREWWGALAEAYYAQGQYQMALGMLKCCGEIPKPRGLVYIDHRWYGSHYHDLTARCLWKLERYEEGLKHARRALEMEPDNHRLEDNLAWFEEKLS